MKLLSISFSNVEPFRDQSASTRVCQMAGEIASKNSVVETEVLPLLDYEMNPCRMCGKCLGTHRCIRDEAFNQVYKKIQEADAVLVVVPHYAFVPSKLVMIGEKLQEMAFLHYCQDRNYRSPVQGKPLGVVAHGGQPANAVPYYQTALVEPVAKVFASGGMQPVAAGDNLPYGVAFGVSALRMPEDSIFCEIEHDWESIRMAITPLVRNLLAAVPQN